MVLALDLGKQHTFFERKGFDAGMPTPLWRTDFESPPQRTEVGKRISHVMSGAQAILEEMVTDASNGTHAKSAEIIGAILDTDEHASPEDEHDRINRFEIRAPWKGKTRNLLVQMYRSKEGETWQTVTEITCLADVRYHMLMQSFLTRQGATRLRAEQVAHKKLRTLLSEVQYSQYVVTDMFFERGKSGVDYLIRKNRPTVAISNQKVLCTMCLHPLGYYSRTWTGALPPSDEAVAHVELIRADEHYFWRKANQIEISMSNSGI